MINGRRRKSRRSRTWYVFIFALFLLGLMVGINLSRRMARTDSSGNRPAQTESQTDGKKPGDLRVSRLCA